MTQKIHDYFGIRLDIQLATWDEEYSKYRSELVEHITLIEDIDLSNVEIYIYCLRLTIKNTHFGVSPINARLSKLGITIRTNRTASRKGFIWFLNPDISNKFNSDVDIKSGRSKIAYSLSGEYLSQNKNYTDYIAAIVMKNCPKKQKTLSITATAYATAGFGRKLINNETGTATTRILFPLLKEWQMRVPVDE